MKGIVFNVLEELVRRDYGEEAWDALLAEAGLAGAYTSLGSYSDDELYRLVEAAAARSGRTPAEAVRWFGREAVGSFHRRYPDLFAPYADARSFVLALNGIIHPEVRKLYPGASVPAFAFDVPPGGPPGGLRMTYASPRRMCAFAEGLLEGTAAHFGETVAVRQTACMHRGDPACVFELRFQPLPATA
ncbi:MAG TPA: heme NO-binding domain-containing protein [Rubricoccaceae bacterium]|nr:heme NO-binding domain-containing protein [Rubricoccaceae bacterium]